MENWRSFVAEAQQKRLEIPEELKRLSDSRIYYRAALFQWSVKNLSNEVQEGQIPHSSYHGTAGSLKSASGVDTQNAIFSADEVYTGKAPNENNAKVLAVKILLNNLGRELPTYPHSQIAQDVKRYISEIRSIAVSYKKEYKTAKLYSNAVAGLRLKVSNISQISSDFESRRSAKRSGNDFKSKEDTRDEMLVTSYDFIEGVDNSLNSSMINQKVQKFHKVASSDWASRKNWKRTGTEDIGMLDRKSAFDS